MSRSRRLAGALLLLSSAAALPGCFFARTCIPLDPEGMEVPFTWVSDTFADQVERTSDRVASLPADLADHTADCWRNLTTFPGE